MHLNLRIIVISTSYLFLIPNPLHHLHVHVDFIALFLFFTFLQEQYKFCFEMVPSSIWYLFFLTLNFFAIHLSHSNIYLFSLTGAVQILLRDGACIPRRIRDVRQLHLARNQRQLARFGLICSWCGADPEIFVLIWSTERKSDWYAHGVANQHF